MEDNQELSELLLKYPGLIAEKNRAQKLCLRGIVRVKGLMISMKLYCPNFPQLQDMLLMIAKDFIYVRYTLANCEVIQPQWKVRELIENLPTIMSYAMEHSEDGRSPQEEQTAPPFDLTIYDDIASLFDPELYKIEINAVCSRIRFSEFAEFEAHYLDVELPSLKVLDHSLPAGRVPWEESLEKCLSLKEMLHLYKKYLEDLRPFYESFMDIDELCYVISPLKPSTKDNSRMFVLKDRVYLKVTIDDPFAPMASMSVHIIGPTYEVERLRCSYSEGLNNWDAELDIHKNLLRIFDLCYFPMPPGNGSGVAGMATEEMDRMACNICYCYEMDGGEVPVVSCDNPKCETISHASCLKRWFNTLTESKTFLDVAFGTCPFCKSKLSTSLVELLEQ